MNRNNPGLALAPPAGSHIVIAGGCGGIGRELVTACLDAGLELTVMDLPASIARHPPPAGVRALEIDASDEASVQRAFAAVGDAASGIAGFVNLCGFKLDTLALADTSAEIFDAGIAGNLRSAFLLSRAALPLLLRNRDASIVHVSSGLGSYGGNGYGPYAIAKGGINTLVRILARENGSRLRANAVAPGLVDTAFTRGGTGRSNEDGASSVDLAAYLRQIPAGRVALPADIVGPVLFLLGPASRFVNGQVLHVNGGGYLP